jgi:hypothetical protein
MSPGRPHPTTVSGKHQQSQITETLTIRDRTVRYIICNRSANMTEESKYSKSGSSEVQR